jgi:hypothetical protein
VSVPVTFAAFGASVTANPTFSWAPHASDGVDVLHVGGFSHGGYRSYQVAENAEFVDSDVTVLVIGTNDVSNERWRVPLSTTLSALREIITKSGAKRALIVAQPPRDDGFHLEARQLDTDIRNYATSMGWMWVDPWTTLRTSDNKYVPGWTIDGIHPTPAGGARVGHWLHYMIRAAK